MNNRIVIDITKTGFSIATSETPRYRWFGCVADCKARESEDYNRGDTYTLYVFQYEGGGVGIECEGHTSIDYPSLYDFLYCWRVVEVLEK